MPHELVAPPVIDDPVDVDLMRAIGALPRDVRAAIALHYLDDLPVEEVASTLGVHPRRRGSTFTVAAPVLAELLHEEHDDAAH